MNRPVGFRTDKSADNNGLVEIRPAAAMMPDTNSTSSAMASRGADYAYRIAALTAGLILLATVM